MTPTLAKAAISPGKPEGSSGLCVLIVEDDEADAYLISRALWAQPVVGAVVRAVDGVDALKLLEGGEVAPDLAFIDLNMPRKNGLSLLVALADHSEVDFPVVVLTSSIAPADAIRGRLRGAIHVVSKPEMASELETVLKSAIDLAYRGGAKRAKADE